MWAIIILVIGGLALKVYWDHGQDESAKRKAYIRDLNHRMRLSNAGINPDTMQAFDQDHSHDYCNANSPCPGCEKVHEANMAKNKAAWAEWRRQNA